MPDGTLLGPGALAKAVTKPYVTTYAWQTGDYCTHAGKVYKFIGEDLTQGEEWTPEHWSETKITDELNNLQDQIDNMTPETGTSMSSDIPFTINTNQWAESNGIYSYNYSNALIKSTSGIQVFYDPAFRNFVGDSNVAKYTGYLTFTTTRQPVGAITGTIRIIDSISGTLPVTRGGTGAVNAKGARQNLNVSIKPIPIDFGTVSSLPQTAYDDDITAEMIAVRWDIGMPSACPKGITCTAAAGSVTISLDSNQTFSGESAIKLWLVNPRTVADNGTGQNQDQYVGDYVQVGAQTLTPTQKAQVLTNIGGASAASVTDLANSIGTVPSGETVEGQITEINSNKISYNLASATAFTGDVYSASAGFYRCASSATNIPVSANGYLTVIVRANDTKYLQYVTDSGRTFSNTLNGVSWTGWEELALNSNLATKTATITGSDSWSFNQSVKKVANIVTFIGYATSTSALQINSWTVLGTLPEGYRPNVNGCYVPAYDNTNDSAVIVRIAGNGVIDVYSKTAAKTIAVNFTFCV